MFKGFGVSPCFRYLVVVNVALFVFRVFYFLLLLFLFLFLWLCLFNGSRLFLFLLRCWLVNLLCSRLRCFLLDFLGGSGLLRVGGGRGVHSLFNFVWRP